MKPTEILIKEHVLIQLLLDILEVALRKMESGERPAPEFFEKMIQFSETFVSRLHQRKEEQVLFRKLADKKKDFFEPIASFRLDHEHQLAHLAAIGRALPGYGAGRDQETGAVLSNLAAFHSLLRQHIHREDHLLFPAVDREFSESEQAELLELFKKEIRDAGGNLFEKCQLLALEMRALL